MLDHAVLPHETLPQFRGASLTVSQRTPVELPNEKSHVQRKLTVARLSVILLVRKDKPSVSVFSHDRKTTQIDVECLQRVRGAVVNCQISVRLRCSANTTVFPRANEKLLKSHKSANM